MSNLYVTEPATNAKVIVVTTAGEIEIELWGRECPKTVRNFLALSMEGYYDNVIFHRLVPNFIVQTGDPTGTGLGGESFYGEPFQDEKHGRLRFNRRGLVGMANSGKRNTNTSQFFFTLDKADELTNKHTLFGKVVGNTIYNLMDLSQLDVDAEERPVNPPKIKTIRIVENPFEDIVPRITAAEKREQQKAKLEAKQEAEKRDKRAKAKKNTGLLSFGEAEEGAEEARAEKEKERVKRKGLTRQDLVETMPSVQEGSSSVRAADVPESSKVEKKDAEKKEKKVVDLKEIRANHSKDKAAVSSSRQAEIKRMQDDLRALKKASGQDSDSDSDTSSTRRKRRKGPSYLEQELAKYQKGKGRAAARAGNKRSRRDEEDDLLEELGAFSKRVTGMGDEERDLDEDGQGEEEGLEVDDDVDWMKHRLKFVVDEKELTRRAEDEYSVIDPRAKARQLADEDKRKGKGQGHRM